MTHDKQSGAARSMSTGRKHNQRTREAHGPFHAALPPAGRVEEMREGVEEALSQGRLQNPYDTFSDEAGTWNEGFATAWEIVRTALTGKVPQ